MDVIAEMETSIVGTRVQNPRSNSVYTFHGSRAVVEVEAISYRGGVAEMPPEQVRIGSSQSITNGFKTGRLGEAHRQGSWVDHWDSHRGDWPASASVRTSERLMNIDEPMEGA